MGASLRVLADLEALFARIDTDGSGALDREELRLGVRRECDVHSEVASDEELDALNALLDDDGDGNVSVAELKAFCFGTLSKKKRRWF